MKYIISIILFVSSSLFAQVLPEWIKFYNGGNEDNSGHIVLDRNRNIIITGTASNKMIVIKYSTDGNLIWFRTPFNDITGLSVALDSSDNIFAMGQNMYNATKLIKYNRDGDSLWSLTYNYNSFIPNSLCVDKFGNSYINFIFNGSRTVKYDSNGTLLWDRVFLPTDGSFAGGYIFNRSMKLDYNGNIYVTSCINGGSTNQDLVTIKYNTNGDSLWTRLFDNNNNREYGYCISLDENNNVYIGGATFVNGILYSVLIKYGNSGNLLWNNISGGTYDVSRDLKCANGFLYTVNYSLNTNPGYSPLRKFSYNGDSIWTAYYNENNSNFVGNSIEVDNLNNVFVGGYIVGNNNDFAAIKFNSSGTKLWDVRYDGSMHGDDISSSTTLDNYKLIITGKTLTSVNNYDIITIKYNSEPIGIIKICENIPQNYTLVNYPNPFNSETIIKLELPKSSLVKLKIYNSIGEKIEELLNQYLPSGVYEIRWNATKYTSGIYFVKTEGDNFTEVTKLVLLK